MNLLNTVLIATIIILGALLIHCKTHPKAIDYRGYWMPTVIDVETNTAIIPKNHITEFKKSPLQDCEKYSKPKLDWNKWKECNQKRLDALHPEIDFKDEY